MSAFTEEVSKTLGILPIDITNGNKTSLSSFFVIDSTTNYNIFLGRDWIHANWYVSSSLHPFLLFGKGNEVVQSLRRSMMSDYSQKEKAATATTVFKMKMQ